MTYEDLAKKIADMTPEQRGSDVTIVDMETNEGFGSVNLSFVEPESDEDFGLDDNHPFIYFSS